MIYAVPAAFQGDVGEARLISPRPPDFPDPREL